MTLGNAGKFGALMCVIWTFFDLFRLALRARKRRGAIGFGAEILLLPYRDAGPALARPEGVSEW